MLEVQKAWNTSSQYSVFKDGKYVGMVYSVAGRKWSTVFDARIPSARHFGTEIAYVKGHDAIKFGASLLDY